MLKPKILVTGATGKTGGETVKILLAKGFPVRALIHAADARSEALRRAGAEIAVGSLEDWEEVTAALSGVQRAYFCPPLEPGALRRATLFAAAAQAARLEVVVNLSQWLVDPAHAAVHAREKWLADQVFRWMPDVGSVTVNPGWFADNYMVALEPAAHLGLFAMPLGNGLNAPASNQDMARVIAFVLMSPAEHIGKTYRPTGPKLLSPADIADTFGRVLGRRVRYQDAPLPLFLKVAKSMKLSDFVISQLYSFLLDYQRNSFGIGAPTSTVLEVTGTPPEDFEVTARRYCQAAPHLRPGAAGTARALWNLVRALATKAPQLHKIAANLRLPVIGHGRLAADSELWRASHCEGGAPT